MFFKILCSHVFYKRELRCMTFSMCGNERLMKELWQRTGIQLVSLKSVFLYILFIIVFCI
jgi:hypothetical protein